MTNFLSKWKETPLLNKITTVIVLISSTLIIVLALLQLLNVWQDAAFVYLPLTCVNMLALAVSNWKTSRSAAIVNLVATGIILVCFVAVVLLRHAAG